MRTVTVAARSTPRWSRADHQEVFQLLANELPDIANAMSPIEPLVFNDNTALFRLMRKETVDGVEYGSWKT